MNRLLITVFLILVPFQVGALEVIEGSEPRYPTSPICRDDAGDVTLAFSISSDGSPEDIEVVDAGSSRFVRSSIKAMARYKFKSGSFSTEKQYLKTFSFQPSYKCGEGA